MATKEPETAKQKAARIAKAKLKQKTDQQRGGTAAQKRQASKTRGHPVKNKQAKQRGGSLAQKSQRTTGGGARKPAAHLQARGSGGPKKKPTLDELIAAQEKREATARQHVKDNPTRKKAAKKKATKKKATKKKVSQRNSPSARARNYTRR